MVDGGSSVAQGSLGNGVKEVTAAGIEEMKYPQICPLCLGASLEGNINTITWDHMTVSLKDWIRDIN